MGLDWPCSVIVQRPMLSGLSSETDSRSGRLLVDCHDPDASHRFELSVSVVSSLLLLRLSKDS